MKKLIVLLCILISFQTLGQKKYSFDYSIVYEESCNKHEKPNEMIYLINSKKNNYKVLAHEKDSTSFIIHFWDEDGVSVYGAMTKKDFYKVETISNECSQTFRYTSLAKITKDDYDIINCGDTVVNDTSYYHYKIVSTKSLKYQKRKKIVTAHFIIDKNKSEFSPFFSESVMYERWVDDKKIPNGLVKIIYFVDTDGKTTSKLSLQGIIKIDKYLTIPEECDYTKEEIRNYMPKVTFGR